MKFLGHFVLLTLELEPSWNFFYWGWTCQGQKLISLAEGRLCRLLANCLEHSSLAQRFENPGFNHESWKLPFLKLWRAHFKSAGVARLSKFANDLADREEFPVSNCVLVWSNDVDFAISLCLESRYKNWDLIGERTEVRYLKILAWRLETSFGGHAAASFCRFLCVGL